MKIYALPGRGYTDYLVRNGSGSDTLARINDDGTCHVAEVLTALGVKPCQDRTTFENRLRHAGFTLVTPGQTSSVSLDRKPDETRARRVDGPQPLVNSMGAALKAAGWAG